jgi:hypothetical protein
LKTGNPEQDYQDHLQDQDEREDDIIEQNSYIMTPEEIDEHIRKIKRNRMSRFEKFREDFVMIFENLLIPFKLK